MNLYCDVKQPGCYYTQRDSLVICIEKGSWGALVSTLLGRPAGKWQLHWTNSPTRYELY